MATVTNRGEDGHLPIRTNTIASLVALTVWAIALACSVYPHHPEEVLVNCVYAGLVGFAFWFLTCPCTWFEIVDGRLPMPKDGAPEKRLLLISSWVGALVLFSTAIRLVCYYNLHL